MKATQLTAFDASFLALDTNISVGHVTLLSLLDREVSPDELFHQIEAHLHLAPMLRRKLRAPSLIVGRPWWVDDPDFDLDDHLTFTDLGGHADEAAMCAEAVRFSRLHLDRSRPLWELLLIGGMADGTGALVSKIHHCAVDGVGKRDLLSLLFGTESSLDPHRRWRPDGGPGQLSRITHRVTEATERTGAALRDWLAENDALTTDPLIAMVPMSIRGQGHSVGSNQIMLTLCPLPTHLDTPRERLAFAHSAMDHAKATPTYPSTLMSDLAAVAGPTVTQLLTQAAAMVRLADRVQLPFNLMVSNVPAPAREFIVGRGARVIGSFPFPPLSDGMGLSVCAQGYPGALDIGIGSCSDLLPDPWRVRDLLEQAHDDLIASA